MDPASWQARFNLGLALAADGRRAEALDALNEAVRLDPENPRIRAEIRRVQGRTD